MLAIDFEKAFDSLNFIFFLRVLHAFNFGPSFTQWIRRVLYNNASSCVMNNGFTTGPLALSRGVRQGDPLCLPVYNSFGGRSYKDKRR